MLDKTIVYILLVRRGDEMVVERGKDLEIAAILRDLRHFIEPREYNHKFGFDSDLSSSQEK
jgi:hypothetical protein